MSYAPEFLVSGSWAGNAQRFDTEAEALASAADRFSAWMMPSDFRAAESIDPVNYKRVDDRDEHVTLEKVSD